MASRTSKTSASSSNISFLVLAFFTSLVSSCNLFNKAYWYSSIVRVLVNTSSLSLAIIFGILSRTNLLYIFSMVPPFSFKNSITCVC